MDFQDVKCEIDIDDIKVIKVECDADMKLEVKDEKTMPTDEMDHSFTFTPIEPFEEVYVKLEPESYRYEEVYVKQDPESFSDHEDQTMTEQDQARSDKETPKQITKRILSRKNSAKNKFKCEICSHESRHAGNFKKHLLVHQKVPSGKWYKCKICPFISKYKKNLHKHEKGHKATYTCDVCQTTFSKYLKQKTRVHRDMCQMCPFTANWNGSCKLCSFKVKYPVWVPYMFREHIGRHIVRDVDSDELFKVNVNAKNVKTYCTPKKQ